MSLFDIGKNAVAAQIGKEIIKKIHEINPAEIMALLIKEAHALNEELAKDGDGDGIADSVNIKNHLEVAVKEFSAAFKLLEAAQKRQAGS